MRTVLSQKQAEGKLAASAPALTRAKKDWYPMTQAKSVLSTPPTNTPKITKASQADPIFAAIEKHRKLFKAWDALYDALERAETKAKKKYGRRPWSLIAWRNYSAIGGSEIEDRREEFLKLPGIDPKKIEKEYLAAKARERAAERAERAWDKRAGLAAQRLELRRVMSASRRAAILMAQIRPHTLAGAAALLTYAKADMEGDGIDWHEIALNTAINTLASWGKVPPRPNEGQCRHADKPTRRKAVA